MRVARLVVSVVGLIALSAAAIAAPRGHDSIERWADAAGGRDRLALVHAIYREAAIQVAEAKA